MLIGQNNGYINAIPHTVFYDKPSSNVSLVLYVGLYLRFLYSKY